MTACLLMHTCAARVDWQTSVLWVDRGGDKRLSSSHIGYSSCTSVITAQRCVTVARTGSAYCCLQMCVTHVYMCPQRQTETRVEHIQSPSICFFKTSAAPASTCCQCLCGCVRLWANNRHTAAYCAVCCCYVALLCLGCDVDSLICCLGPLGGTNLLRGHLWGHDYQHRVTQKGT